MIKEFRVLGNNRLFKEVLSDSSTVKLINRSSDSLFVKYRNHKNPETRGLTLKKSHELTNRIRDYFARLEVDFTIIELTITEVKRVIAVYFAKVNNCKLTESQLALIDDLRGRTACKRRKEARQKRFKEAKSLRLFLKDQNIVYVKSSKEKNEFVKIKLIHDAYLEKKPYDKIQKEYLEKLRLRTRDLSNNFIIPNLKQNPV